MTDRYGRTIDYARISITDRCNLRCVYCMPAEGVPKLERSEVLSYEMLLAICRAMVSLGIVKFKVTGGEPLVRKGCTGFVAALKRIAGVRSVTLTTNGLLLPGAAAALRAAGLDGVNISLDTLDPARYQALTRGGRLEDALEGVRSALKAGLRVKLNCVPTAGSTPDDLVRLAAIAQAHPVEVRFIELMPVGPGAHLGGIPNRQVADWLEAVYGPAEPYHGRLGNGPARYVHFPGFIGRIGWISAMGDCFCGHCNRIRLSSAGRLAPCLCLPESIDLRPALAAGETALCAAIREGILSKPARHHFEPGVEAGGRTMSQVGG